jgi:V8-like Glu-specific endopeptidase
LSQEKVSICQYKIKFLNATIYSGISQSRRHHLKFLLGSFLLLSLSCFSFSFSFAATQPFPLIPKVIYGIDDRMDVYQSSDSLLRELSNSTAAQIPRDSLILDGAGYSLHGKTLEQSGMCKSERFSNQPAAADCSGFLIAPDVLVTAGHCITSLSACDNSYWVFDYANKDKEEVVNFKFNQNQVFYCTKIIKQVKDKLSMNDFAVVKLNRAVPNRNYLKIRTTGKIADNATVAILGYPTGLPLKITSNAVIRDNKNNIYFRINSDTYGGNSGSAVVDMATGLVEGILVRGDTDYIRNSDGCYTSVIRTETSGRGEDATRITNLKL